MKKFNEFKLNTKQQVNTVGKGRPETADRPADAGLPTDTASLPEEARVADQAFGAGE